MSKQPKKSQWTKTRDGSPTTLDRFIHGQKFTDEFHLLIAGCKYILYHSDDYMVCCTYDGFFICKATNYEDFLIEMSVIARKRLHRTDVEIIQAISLVVEKHQVNINGRMVAQMPKDLFPKRFNKRSGAMIGMNVFYIVKKDEYGKAIKSQFCVYSWKTGLKIKVGPDKDMLRMWLAQNIEKVENRDRLPDGYTFN